jgi:uncharacterized protein YdeI (BOF family)
LLLVLAMTVSAFVACNMSNTSDPTDAPTDASTDAPTDKPTDEPTEQPTDSDEGEADDDWADYDVITIAEALELCGEPGNLTTERYYIRATIISIDNAQFGQMTIGDETGTIAVYGTYSADGEINYSAMAEKPYKGDEVLLHCTLQNYNGTKEVKNARLIDFKHVDVEINESDYTDMSIADAREAAVGTKIKIDGVVARITYANGMIPMGVYIVDETQSIYVYDGDIAQRVAIGNKITVLGAKAYWILENEQNNAQKFGYKGCCQLEDAVLLNNDEKTNEIDLSWVESSTVKAIMDTPVTENITTTIFKVNALVKKAPNNGFTNYYFNDLDGTTGSYTYTQCNGNDFAWLDEFDGKICTVYLSVINAKSSTSGCVFRFVPIKVVDEGFKFDLNNTAEHVVKYYGIDQFNASYTGNPAKELVTTVSSELLGFEGATLSYSSSNENVVYFTTEGGKTVFNCKDAGKATVTVKGEYDGKSYTETIDVVVVPNVEYDNITIEEAKDKEVGEEVIIKGIVGPSLVNKSGFYLFDETGMIAITVNESVFDNIAIGYEVVLKGKRDCFIKEGNTHAGQLAISNCEVLANYYGEHDYHTFDFIEDKDVKYIYDLDYNEQHSDEVYYVKATVKVVETAYYTNIFISDGSTDLRLYCSSANQYSFLKQFAGQQVFVEIAPCNWNDKDYYTGCVLAVETQDGVVLNTFNFK